MRAEADFGIATLRLFVEMIAAGQANIGILSGFRKIESKPLKFQR
jgi:hypothetical protein